MHRCKFEALLDHLEAQLRLQIATEGLWAYLCPRGRDVEAAVLLARNAESLALI